MPEAVAPTRSRRLPFWAIIIALVISAFGGAFVLLWFKLPTWAPEWVVEHSPWIDPIIRSVEQDSSLSERAWKRLAGRGGAVAPAMIAYLESDREETVTVACRVLREVVNPEMIVPVMRRVKAGRRSGMGLFDLANLAEALSKQKADLVVDALLPLSDSSEESLLMQISIAGRMDDLRAIDALRVIIWEPAEPAGNPLKESFGHSATAVTSLLYSPVPTAKSVIILALEDPAAHVRLRAVSGLTSPVGRKSLDADLASTLTKRLKDTDLRVREAAVVAAAFNPLPGIEPELISWLEAPDPKERSLGLTGLGAKHASEQAIAAIAKCLHDPESRVQNAAIRALDRTANPLVVPFLLESYPPLTVKAKQEVLRTFRQKEVNQQPQVFPFLLSAMGDPDMDTAKVAEEIIWRIHLTDEQHGLAESARDALQKRRDQGTVKPAAP